jgi:hypothetical protein
VHSSLLQWLIPRLPYNLLNGYDAEGKNPLCVAVEFNNKAVINAFLREPMHRIDYCAPPLIIETKDGKESKDKKDEIDPCMPHKSYESKPLLPYQLQVHRHVYIDCPTMNQLEYITKYQLNVDKPKRTECLVQVFTFFAKPVLEILLKQCGLPLPIVTKSPVPSVGEKRKRKDYEEQSTHASLPT